MRKLFPALTLASFAALLPGTAPVAAEESATAADSAIAAEPATAAEAPGFSRAAVRALVAEVFASDEPEPPAPAGGDTGGLERELGGNLKLELRYSRGPFENHLADPREAEHSVFLQLRARL
ncbi:hypothetical protein [Thioalkalivibrio sp. XN8]|uniref:hypothetical protein n=1 Tax=Thioalkalivibrio sp. XN8 TaxID=2712863 RepID=UPI0013ECD515|nr:hypothetical protein [Thioalkalivibrio sp. XN8]NGP52045.1 hypothetical protein [Thioalkalivibrio sp. XN8]